MKSEPRLSVLCPFYSLIGLARLSYEFSFTVCGKVVDNTLKSPGYPNNYPNNASCIYVVPIPRDMDMNITFKDFYIQDDESCL